MVECAAGHQLLPGKKKRKSEPRLVSGPAWVPPPGNGMGPSPSPLKESEGRELAGDAAFAPVGRVAVDGAVLDGAVEFGDEFAGLVGGAFLVLGSERSLRFAREGFEAAQGAAIAGRAHDGLTGAFGGGFDIGHIGDVLLWCQRGESNSRPRAYESPALPLSYPGI